MPFSFTHLVMVTARKGNYELIKHQGKPKIAELSVCGKVVSWDGEGVLQGQPL